MDCRPPAPLFDPDIGQRTDNYLRVMAQQRRPERFQPRHIDVAFAVQQNFLAVVVPFDRRLGRKGDIDGALFLIDLFALDDR